MADNTSSGSGFMGLIAGLLIAALLVGGGMYMYNHGMFGGGSTDINVNLNTPGENS